MSNKKQRQRELNEILNPQVLTLDQALALADAGEVQDRTARIKSMWKAVHALDDRVRCRFTGPSNFHRLNPGEQMVWDLTQMHREVLNGGFHQYLTNSTADSGEALKLHLKRIGDTTISNLFDRLSQIFPGGVIPQNRDTRHDILQGLENDGMDVTDEITNAYPDEGEELARLILAYVQTHRNEFAEPTDEIVHRLKRHDEITAHVFGSAEPEWVNDAENALERLSAFAKSVHDQQESELREQLKLLAKSGQRLQAINEYKTHFGCDMAAAKAAIDQLLAE